MITIPDKTFNSSLRLADILYVMKKDELLKIANRLDFYVSPNVNTIQRNGAAPSAPPRDHSAEWISQMKERTVLRSRFVYG